MSVTDQTNANTSYGYDAGDRLVSEATPTGMTSYTYDSVGNRLSKTVGGTTTSYTYEVDDRNSAYVYNLNGDVLNDGTHSYSYDFEDHLTA